MLRTCRVVYGAPGALAPLARLAAFAARASYAARGVLLCGLGKLVYAVLTEHAALGVFAAFAL